MTVCRVPTESNNSLYVAQALGEYQEQPCGPFQVCESYNSRITRGANGVDTRLAVWYTCTNNNTAIAITVVFAALLLALVWLAWRRRKAAK